MTLKDSVSPGRVAATRPGEALSLVVVRTPGQQIELKIVVGERPRARQAAR